MQARIYQTSPSPTQSGTGIKKWTLDFPYTQQKIDQTMGWTSSTDTMPQVKIYFDTKEDAIEFAQHNGWHTEIIMQNNQHRLHKKSYTENFID